jgi:hypothetical protein
MRKRDVSRRIRAANGELYERFSSAYIIAAVTLADLKIGYTGKGKRRSNRLKRDSKERDGGAFDRRSPPAARLPDGQANFAKDGGAFRGSG